MLHKSFLKFRSQNMSSLAGVLQVSSSLKTLENFQSLRSLLVKAKNSGASMAFLPYVYEDDDNNNNDGLPFGKTLTSLSELANSLSLTLSLSQSRKVRQNVQEKDSSPSHIIISSKGEIESLNDKGFLCHDIQSGIKGYTPFTSETQIYGSFSTPIGRMAFADSFAVSQLEMSCVLRNSGVEVLTTFLGFQAFEQWKASLRATAIKNQIYVISSAQVGDCKTGNRSLVIDPLGVVIAEGSHGPRVLLAEIDLEFLQRIRVSYPSLGKEMKGMNQRFEFLPSSFPSPTFSKPLSGSFFSFGPVNIKSEHVILTSEYSYVTVNKKPLVKGHVLVIPRRENIKKMCDLHPREISDLFATVVTSESLLMNYFDCSSATISIQDGPDAGQTIPHVHVHILPRKKGDFRHNDDIYVALETHDKDEGIPWRNDEEMFSEASELRNYFFSQH